jgi:hypothetical protein
MRVTNLLCGMAVTSALGLALASPAFATSIVANGDFSNGNAGFGSSYAYNQDNCWADGSIAIVSSPGDCHSLWASFGDHTSGTGQMMVVNGATTVGKVVWSDPVAIAANTDYYFSAWIASSYSANPAQLAFSINGVALAAPFTLGLTTGDWQQFSVPWNSGDRRLAVVALVNQNVAFGGNDFAIDDIALDTAAPLTANPEPASLTLLATGLFGAAAILRRRRPS